MLAIYSEQGNGRLLQPGGSIMWSREWGWEVLLRHPAQQYSGNYINVTTAANDDAQIRDALSALQNAMSMLPSQASSETLDAAPGSSDPPIQLSA